MTMAQLLGSHFTLPQSAEFCLRILVACACGAVIGIERSRRFKEAGVRTHVIVCAAAALLMVVSKYGFADLFGPDGNFSGAREADPARIAAQVVTGVGFLGAGVIFRNGNTVKGLTTAAGLWATAGIGLTVGAGLYWLGVFVTLVIALLQYLMHRFTVGADSYVSNLVRVTAPESAEFRDYLKAKLEKWKAQTTEMSVTRLENGLQHYEMTLLLPKYISSEEVLECLRENSDIRDISVDQIN
jgi:putative Mg2+ transporter-C (MgtC) family protein